MKHALAWRAACAGAAGVVAFGAATASAAPAQGSHAVTTHLAYNCRFPSGTRHVQADITATFPRRVPVGGAVRTSSVSVSMTAPRAALAGLGHDPALVSGTARLTVSVNGGGKASMAPWPNLAISPSSLPDTTSVALTASGHPSPFPVDGPGTVRFSAGALRLNLATWDADSNQDGEAAAVTCALAPDQQPLLASVRITAVSTDTAGQSPPAHRDTPGYTTGPVPPAGLLADGKAATPNDSPSEPPPGTPPHCFDTLPKANPGTALACGHMAGYSNVDKLHSASILGKPQNGVIYLDVGEEHSLKCSIPGVPPAQCESQGGNPSSVTTSSGKLDMPPSSSTFLAFDFMPTTASIQLEEKGLLSITARVVLIPPFPQRVTVKASMILHIRRLTVNGKVLDVGTHCRTTEPLHSAGSEYLLLHGASDSNPPYRVMVGGLLTATATIPSFTGCGVSEDLDPLLTASISGPGNLVHMTQGHLCLKSGYRNCPPEKVKKPIR